MQDLRNEIIANNNKIASIENEINTSDMGEAFGGTYIYTF